MKKTGALVLALALGFSLLSGCGTSEKETPDGNPPSGGEREKTFVYGTTGYGAGTNAQLSIAGTVSTAAQSQSASQGRSQQQSLTVSHGDLVHELFPLNVVMMGAGCRQQRLTYSLSSEYGMDSESLRPAISTVSLCLHLSICFLK